MTKEAKPGRIGSYRQMPIREESPTSAFYPPIKAAMTKHTPTPWLLIEDPAGWTISNNGFDITAAPFDCSNDDAAFIVRAVNAHDELVAALQEAESLLNNSNVRDFITRGMGEHSWLHRTINAARAALAKAGA